MYVHLAKMDGPKRTNNEQMYNDEQQSNFLFGYAERSVAQGWRRNQQGTTSYRLKVQNVTRGLHSS